MVYRQYLFCQAAEIHLPHQQLRKRHIFTLKKTMKLINLISCICYGTLIALFVSKIVVRKACDFRREFVIDFYKSYTVFGGSV